MTQTTLPSLAHQAAAHVDVPSDYAFDRLSEAGFVGQWSLGSMGLEAVGDGVFRGRSLFDGSAAFVEIRAERALGLIDFHVGTAQARCPRIFIRVTPGPVLGIGAHACLVTLHALRAGDATDEGWARTCLTHEAEILLIKAQLETAWAEGGA
ncbi:MAG: hypothetical protein JJU15_04695 [Pararhodobacter sp.]|nr:hypothetical protein [Pararhodobacter sp.]